jgi:hypothetical protein
MVTAYLMAGELTGGQVADLAQLDGVRRMEYLTDHYQDADAYTAAVMDFAIRQQQLTDAA